MEKYIEFITNHPAMVAAWIFTLILFLLFERRKSGAAVSPAQTTSLINKENGIVLDIRPKKEWATGHITGAIHIPFADLEHRINELDKYKQKPIIVACNIGQIAGSAVRKLSAQGFEKPVRLAGGMTEWKSQNLPVVK